MQAPDYGNILHKLLTFASLHEQLHNKYPELLNHLEEVFHKEYEEKEVNNYIKELKESATHTLEDLEKVLLLPQLPKLEVRHTEVLRDVLQLAQTATSFKVYKPPASAPVRIFLEGCWDLMHSGHFNAIRQVKENSYYRIG